MGQLLFVLLVCVVIGLIIRRFFSVYAAKRENDLALALVNMVCQTIGVVAVGAARATANTTVILIGKLATLPQVVPIFDDLSKLLGVEFQIAKLAEFATAVGAAVSIGES